MVVLARGSVGGGGGLQRGGEWGCDVIKCNEYFHTSYEIWG